MAQKSAKVLAVLLMASFMAAYVQTGLAIRPMEQQMFRLPSGFVSNCWEAITGLHGCATQFYAAIATGGFDQIGPTCCEAIISIVDTCWQRMFHHGPFVPPSVKRYCLQHQQTGTTTMAKPLSQDNLN